MPSYDAVVIGAGPNGLVAAAYLAKAGKKVLVLERRPRVGGIAAAEEIFPGFKYFPGAQLAGTFSREIVAELGLQNHGLKIVPLDPLLFAPALSGESLLIPRDRAEAVREISRLSKRDADTFPAFCSLIDKLTAFLRHLYGLPLPGGTGAQSLSLAHLIKVGIRFRRLGKREMHEFLRILPMSIADLLNEWFENEKLKAALAATAILGSFVGPRAQGTAYVFLHHLSAQAGGAFRSSGFVSGGIHKLPEALLRAAQQQGAEVRTGAEVASIATPNGKAGSVVLADGEEISASAVVSSADVKRTFLGLVAPTYLDPHFLLQVKNIRARGTVARVNFALDGLPNFKHGSSAAAAAQLAGIIHIGPTLDYLERAADDAKYGRFSRQPFLEITIPSIADPSVAPQGKHVMSVWMQSAPYSLREGDWNDQRQALGSAVIDAIESYAPGFKRSILHAHVWTPLDLEQTLGVTGGHLDHAELGLDQIFFMRPVPGWADYSTPIENLYLCGSGTHPGGGVSGLPGYYAAARVLKNSPVRK